MACPASSTSSLAVGWLVELCRAWLSAAQTHLPTAKEIKYLRSHADIWEIFLEDLIPRHNN